MTTTAFRRGFDQGHIGLSGMNGHARYRQHFDSVLEGHSPNPSSAASFPSSHSRASANYDPHLSHSDETRPRLQSV
jgi:hypothetical protein